MKEHRRMIISITSAITPPEPRTPFCVRVNGIAIKFHSDRIRNIYEAVTDNEATPFDLFADADITARNYGLRVGSYKIDRTKQS